MKPEEMLLKKEERVSFSLRALFEQYGYRKFKMSKFEEYDFYAENRSFLHSEAILTFTGLDGKLLALKPDVTLSIVKNTKGSRDTAERVYYNENVYRARKGAGEYKEIMQVGLEYIGEVDAYATLEVLLLAQKSLKAISDAYILDVSHMGFVAGLMEEVALPYAQQDRILDCISEKNIHGIRAVCKENGVAADLTERLEGLASLYGSLEETLPQAFRNSAPSANLSSQVIRQEQPLSETAALNPDWVEWLMGFPRKWTDVSSGPPSRRESPVSQKTPRTAPYG
mgnify:CR=1 FL=1